jgi:cysteine-rich repeat protein
LKFPSTRPLWGASLYVAVLLLPTSAVADIAASTAADVCPAMADPCVVAERVVVTPGSALDFGARALVVQGSGLFDFGSGDGSVLAGPIVLGGAGVVAAASGIGGTVKFTARRRCSDEAALPCLGDDECGDAMCSVGSGSLDLLSAWAGRTTSPGVAVLEAADDVLVAAGINLSGSGGDSDGGYVELTSTFGSVRIASSMVVSSGFFGYGGSLEAEAGVDVLVQASIDCTGGDTGGGDVTLAAGRDVTISDDINCNASTAAGDGGSIDIAADRDVFVVGGTAVNRTVLSTFGHRDTEMFAGDGGDIDLYAERNVFVGRFASLVSAGARPDADGGDVTLDGGSAILVEGVLETRADGGGGAAGTIWLDSGGSITLASTATLSVPGGDVGDIDLRSAGPMDLAGTIGMGSTTTGAWSGSFFAESDDDITIRGSLLANRPDHTLDLEACRIVFEPGADWYNNVEDGLNTLVARERLHVRAGALLRTRASGDNVFVYRAASKPPLVEGTVTPAPVLEVAPDLPGCPRCGDGEIDGGETCDDGGTQSGDGCSDECQLESCIAQTVGTYPEVPLCNDDDPCTSDVCNELSGDCEHVFTCTTTTLPPAALCGDANGNGIVQASDALFALKVAVGSLTCPLTVCDVNNNGAVQASDALAILRAAVGQPVELNCPPA